MACFSRGEGRMSTRERLFLTPVEKFLKYGILPSKLLLNALLVALVTSHVVIMNSQESGYVQAAARMWYKFFYPPDYDFSDVIWYSYTVNDTVAALSGAVGNYYNLNNVSLDTFTLPMDSATGLTTAPTLTVTAYSDISALFDASRTFDGATTVTVYKLNSTYLGPLDASLPYSEWATFFHPLVRMDLALPPIQHFAYGSLYRNCFLWSVTLHFDFTNRGQIQYSMDQDVTGTCDVFPTLAAALGAKFQWMNVIIISLAALHSFLILRATWRSLRLMCRLTAWARQQAKQLNEQARAAGIDLDAYGLYDDEEEEAAAPASKDAEGAETPLLLGEGVDSARSPKASNGTGAARSGSMSAPPPRMQIDLHTDMDMDGSGEIFITATPAAVPAALKKGRGGDTPSITTNSRGVVFAPGDVAVAPRSPGARAASFAASIKSAHSHSSDKNEVAPGVSVSPHAQDADEQGQESEEVVKQRLIAAAQAARALNVSWRTLPWRDRVRFINGWAVLSLIADACNIASSVWNLQTGLAHIPSDATHAFLMGFGLSMLWLGVLRYMEHNRTYFNIVLTLRRAAPRVLRFLMGVLPVFIAFSFFAMVMFSDRVPRFCDMRTSFITLFANLNGDVVRETMMAMVAYHPVIAQLFFYSFIALHIYVVLNIIIAVVEESYFITVQKTQEMDEWREEYGAKAAEAEETARKAMQQAWRFHPVDDGHGHAHGDGADGAARGGVAHAQNTGHAASGGAAADGEATVAMAADGSALQVFSSLPPDVLASATAPKMDSNSVKDRPDSQLAVLLRLSEWDEVLTGHRIKSRGRRQGHAEPTTSSSLAVSARQAAAVSDEHERARSTTPSAGRVAARTPASAATISSSTTDAAR